MREDKLREEFEAWITSAPLEKPVHRNPESNIWPGQYKSYEVQLAWEAWQASRAALMTYHRCSEHRKEIAALQAECEKLRERMAEVKELLGFYLNGGSNYREDAERAEKIINEALAGSRHEPKQRKEQ